MADELIVPGSYFNPQDDILDKLRFDFPLAELKRILTDEMEIFQHYEGDVYWRKFLNSDELDGEDISSPLALPSLANEKVNGISTPGGIDFNSDLLDLQIKRDGKGIPLPIHQQPLQHMNIEGFIPVIIQMTPINVPLMLGVTEQNKPGSEYSHHRNLEPMDRRRNKIM